jgi:RND family efflux transporter MFP subunit
MKRYLIAAIVIVVILGGYLGVNAIFTTRVEIPTAPVRHGPFVISLNVNGSVDAKQAYVLSAPRIRGLTITWLAPEGSMVRKGEPVIRFDATEQTAELADHQSSLKIKQTSLERARKELTIQEKQLQLDLQKAERNYDEMKHEAPKIAEEARLELELAELNFDAKLEQLKSDVAKAELEVQRAQEQVNEAQRELEQLTMTAPIPGMVVYLEIWKGGSMSKVQEGDSPWPGQGLVNLPDLSEMVVEATASEVDASMVDSGQTAIVTLDAHPDTSYSGVVSKKGTLARRKEPGSKINVFDVEIDILDEDKKLKPGMSASCRLIIDRIPDVVSVPLEAVFEREGRTVVYLENEERVEVEVGRRNDMFIEIVSGLEGNEWICLADPTVEEHGLPGEKATEPELNKGRQLPQGAEQPRRGRRGGS